MATKLETLRAAYLSVEDRAWEGSWFGRSDVVAVACDTDEPQGSEFDWHDGGPAIAINSGAVLVLACQPKSP